MRYSRVLAPALYGMRPSRPQACLVGRARYPGCCMRRHSRVARRSPGRSRWSPDGGRPLETRSRRDDAVPLRCPARETEPPHRAAWLRPAVLLGDVISPPEARHSPIPRPVPGACLVAGPLRQRVFLCGSIASSYTSRPAGQYRGGNRPTVNCRPDATSPGKPPRHRGQTHRHRKAAIAAPYHASRCARSTAD